MADDKPVTKPAIVQGDLSDEEYREYLWSFNGESHSYKIDNPKTLYTRPGGSTHRVLGADGLVYCLPAPGVWGCVLRWKPRDPANPVKF